MQGRPNEYGSRTPTHAGIYRVVCRCKLQGVWYAGWLWDRPRQLCYGICQERKEACHWMWCGYWWTYSYKCSNGLMRFETSQDLQREKKAIDLFVSRFKGSYQKLAPDDIDYRVFDKSKNLIAYVEVKGRVENIVD